MVVRVLLFLLPTPHLGGRAAAFRKLNKKWSGREESSFLCFCSINKIIPESIFSKVRNR